MNHLSKSIAGAGLVLGLILAGAGCGTVGVDANVGGGYYGPGYVGPGFWGGGGWYGDHDHYAHPAWHGGPGPGIPHAARPGGGGGHAAASGGGRGHR